MRGCQIWAHVLLQSAANAERCAERLENQGHSGQYGEVPGAFAADQPEAAWRFVSTRPAAHGPLEAELNDGDLLSWHLWYGIAGVPGPLVLKITNISVPSLEELPTNELTDYERDLLRGMKIAPPEAA